MPRSIPSAEDEDFNYRFNSISFMGKEGWIVGKPAILLYTSNAGESWERIPLSAQLPGDMVFIYNYYYLLSSSYYYLFFGYYLMLKELLPFTNDVHPIKLYDVNQIKLRKGSKC